MVIMVDPIGGSRVNQEPGGPRMSKVMLDRQHPIGDPRRHAPDLVVAGHVAVVGQNRERVRIIRVFRNARVQVLAVGLGGGKDGSGLRGLPGGLTARGEEQEQAGKNAQVGLNKAGHCWVRIYFVAITQQDSFRQL